MDALFVSIQIIISFVLSLGHVLIPFFMLSGLGLGYQSGFTSLDQSRGEIGSIFGEISYGSAGSYGRPVHDCDGLYLGGFG